MSGEPCDTNEFMSAGTELERRQALFPGVPARRIVHDFSRWLVPELTVTVAARAQLRRWALCGAPEVDARELTGQGNMSILKTARTVLATLPPPVRWHIASSCFIVAVGVDSVAWCDSAPVMLCARLIALSRTSSSDICHEYAHGWLHENDLQQPREILSFTKREERWNAAANLAALWGMEKNKKLEELHRARLDDKTRIERQANALARAWQKYRSRENREGKRGSGAAS